MSYLGRTSLLLLRGFEWHHLWNQCRDVLDLPSDYWWAPRYGLAHSPTEDLIAWCSWDAKVSVANAESLETIWRQSNHNFEDPISRGHTAVVNDITFIHNGSFVASSSRDGSVRIWDSHSGKVLHVIEKPDAIPLCLARNDKQQLLAVSRGETEDSDASARIELYRWDVDSAGKLALSFSGRLPTPDWRMGSLSISTDGQYLAGASTKSTKLWVWDLDAREPIEVAQQHGLVTKVCFSPVRSSELAFTVSLQDDANKLGSIYLLDLRQNVFGKPILVHDAAFTRMKYNRDGSALASGTSDGFVVVGDCQSQSRLAEFRLHSHTVHDVTFSADGQYVIATSANGTVCRLPLRMQHADVRLKKEGGGDVLDVSMSENGRLIAGFGDGSYACFDCVSGELLEDNELEAQYAYGVTVSPNGKHAAIAGGFWPEASGPGEIRLHRLGEIDHPIFAEVNPGSISWCARCSPAGDLIAVSDGPDVRLWELPGMRELPRLRLAGMKASIRKMDFSADGKYLVVLEFQHPSRAHVWDVTSRKVVSSVSLREHHYNTIAISSAGDRIVVPTPNGDLQVLDALTGKFIKTIGNHPRALFALDFSIDDRRLLSAGWNGDVRLWNVETGARLMTWNVDGQIWSACFSPDGNKIAFDSRPYRDVDGSVRVLDGTPRTAEAQKK